MRLREVGPEALVLCRRRNGRGFVYVDEQGQQVRDRETLSRDPRPRGAAGLRERADRARSVGALQAIGRDAAGRIQYRYHPDWDAGARRARSNGWAPRAVLPRLRRAVARDLRRKVLCRRRVLAAVVALIDRTHVRIGCEDYVHAGRSRGAPPY